RRVIAPTTPMQPQRHWVEADGALPIPVSSVLHQLVWEPRALGPGGPIQGPVALIEDAGGVARRLAAALGDDAVIVPSDRALPPGARAVVDPTALDAGGDAVAAQRALIATVGRIRELSSGRLWLLTRSAQRVAGRGGCAAQSLIWGLGRALARERPELRPPLVDLGEGDDPASEIELLLRLIGGDDPEQQSALRAGARSVPELRPLAPSPERLELDGERIYWVIGGLGELGLVLAGWLVHRGARRLVLTGRSAPHGGIQARLEQLEARASVTVRCGDVASPDDVQRILAELEAMGELGGVIHAAGILEDGLLSTSSDAAITRVLRPKVAGAAALDAALGDRRLELFLLCSSAAGLLGSAGQAAYAAANAFLDGLATERRARGLSGTSVVWGPWAELGMAARLGDVHTERLAHAGILPLAPELALAALDAVIRGPAAPVVLHRIEVEPPATPVGSAGAEPPLVELISSLPLEQRHAAVTRFVTERAAATLRRSIDPDQPLWDQGMDSLMAIELRNELSRGGVVLPLGRMLAAPEPSEIATMVLGALTAAPRPPLAAAPAALDEIDPELPPLDPVVSHVGAALGGALITGCLCWIAWLVLG
ncbi:MAG TPA: SDR family NAD(P)-dependent oxidoreductase, partial [Deltaproteobacteria bacterium]|nr:SDR family NAD(P)-dependent oxidoreductase [Deltaproteobacteria bacterium]